MYYCSLTLHLSQKSSIKDYIPYILVLHYWHKFTNNYKKWNKLKKVVTIWHIMHILFINTYLCFSLFSSGFRYVLSFPCLETTLFLLEWAWMTPKIPYFLANGFHLIRFSFRSWKLINNTFQTCLDEELRRQTEEHQRMLDWNS